MNNMTELALFCLPAIFFLPAGYLLVQSLVNPELDNDRRRLPRIIPGLLLASLGLLIVGWVVVAITHLS